MGLACSEGGWTADVLPRILPVGLSFPVAFHVELKGLIESSAGQNRAEDGGTGGSDGFGGAGGRSGLRME